MRKLMLLVAFIGLAVAAVVGAAPPVQPQECDLLADLSWTARVFALEGVERAKADKILARVYDMKSERAVAVMLAITNAAYNPALDWEEAQFASAITAACLRGGNLDGVLGKDS